MSVNQTPAALISLLDGQPTTLYMHSLFSCHKVYIHSLRQPIPVRTTAPMCRTNTVTFSCRCTHIYSFFCREHHSTDPSSCQKFEGVKPSENHIPCSTCYIPVRSYFGRSISASVVLSVAVKEENRETMLDGGDEAVEAGDDKWKVEMQEEQGKELEVFYRLQTVSHKICLSYDLVESRWSVGEIFVDILCLYFGKVEQCRKTSAASSAAV
ncbi:hypothetical protein BJ878DRAFT_519742 [Calycina marina]|uniref:Uncharacterized protein n=1 Tax=Calycina marina TaxID=1763456 RepID=A0A9P7YXM8_9HELO|nr:hypothetical protein BJ878DRAFT_519742 [Calycina marina]